MTEWTEVTPPPQPDPPRDRWGRPRIIPPGGGKLRSYTRCTTYVGCLEDTFNLSMWQKRMVAVGMAQRPDLQLRAASLGLQPDKADESVFKKWKRSLDEVTDAATEAAQASASATIGTSLHALTEIMDRGLQLGVVPEQYRPHLDAYQEKTGDFTAVHIERFTVNDDLEIGGTPDRVLSVPGRDKLIIGDIKTGTVEFGVGKMAMQLAVYAHSVIYDPDTGTRTAIGDVDLEHGMIIALSAETGRCELIDIDLAAGWEAVKLATKVRAWRARKDLTRPWDENVLPLNPGPAPTRQLDPDVSLVKAINQALSPAELVALWHAAGDRWEPAHTELAARRKAELQKLSA